MIVDVLYGIAGSILQVISFVFGSIDFVLPQEIPDAITWLFGLGNYATGIFPIGTLYQALLLYLSAYSGIYLIKLFLMGYSAIPFIGRKINIHHGKK
jgi:hypothetical protein